MNWGSLPIATKTLSKQIAPFDLTLLAAETGDNLLLSLQYNLDLFQPGTIKRMLQNYKILLENIFAYRVIGH